MNLAESVYVGKFDCIFCMNVLMYFSGERRLAILPAFLRRARAGRIFPARPRGNAFKFARGIRAGGPRRLPPLSEAGRGGGTSSRGHRWRERSERPQPRIGRAVPAGGVREPAVSAGVCRAVAGAADEARGPRKALHRRAHAGRARRRATGFRNFPKLRRRWRTSFITR